MKGQISVLNVGEGDLKLSFNSSDPAEVIRAQRIVRDMLRRGYALLVEVSPGQYQRALDFDPTSNSYIIADFDPLVEDPNHDPEIQADRRATGGIHPRHPPTDDGPEGDNQPPPEEAGDPRRGNQVLKGQGLAVKAKTKGRRAIKAAETKAVAVPRTAGG